MLPRFQLWVISTTGCRARISCVLAAVLEFGKGLFPELAKALSTSFTLFLITRDTRQTKPILLACFMNRRRVQLLLCGISTTNGPTRNGWKNVERRSLCKRLFLFTKFTLGRGCVFRRMAIVH